MRDSTGVYDQDHAESSDRSELGMVTKNNVHSLTTDSEYSESGMVEYNGNTANSNAFKERIERHSTYLSSSGKHSYFPSRILHNSFVKLMLY